MTVLWSLVALYAVIFVSLRLPAVQNFVAGEVCSALEDKLKTRVSCDRIEIGIPNRIIIDGLKADDQQKHPMLDSKRLSAKIDIIPLLSGEISISSIQIFGLDAHITKANADAPLNCQFVIDAFKSKDTEKSPLNLHVSSIILRHSAVAYDRLDMPKKPGVFDVNHLAVSKISGHVMLPLMTDDKLMLKIKKLSLQENSSGLEIKNLHLDIAADTKLLKVSDFGLETANSDLSFTGIAKLRDKKLLSYDVRNVFAHVSTRDLAAFVPQLKGLDKRVTVKTHISGTDSHLSLHGLTASSGDKGLALSMNARLRKEPSLNARISDIDMHISSAFANDILSAVGASSLVKISDALQHIDYKGDAVYSEKDMSVKGLLSSAIGDLNHDISLHDNVLTAKLQTPMLHLANLKVSDKLGDVKADISLNATIDGGLKDISLKNIRHASLTADIPLLTYGGHQISGLSLDATDNNNAVKASLAVNDENVQTDVNVLLSDVSALIVNDKRECSLEGSVDVRHFNPDNMGLSTRWPHTDFAFSSDITIADVKNILRKSEVLVNDLKMMTPKEQNDFGMISASCEKSVALGTKVTLSSEFCDATLSGYFDINTLLQSVTNIISSKLPTLPGVPQYHAAGNSVNFDISVSDATPLNKILGVDIICNEPVMAKGFIDDKTSKADITVDAPLFSYNGTKYQSTSLEVHSNAESMTIDADLGMVGEDGDVFVAKLDAKASGNTMQSLLAFNNGRQRLVGGELYTNMRFDKTLSGQPVTYINVEPSLLMTGDTIWNIRPSEVVYSAEKLSFHNFTVEHNNQHVIINGDATKTDRDSIVADLHDVNVGYILDLVNFHSVDFDGLASGRAVVKSLFSTPQASASLKVRNFLFQSGRMGTLYADASWNNEEGQIDIDARCVGNPFTGEEKTTTYINGFVSPKKNTLSLNIKAIDTPAEFMEGFCGSFMHDVNMTTRGEVWIGGPLSTINMTGELDVTGTVGFQALGTTYRLDSAHVSFRPDVISFSGDTIHDSHNQTGVVTGTVTHSHLSRWHFDLGVDVKHLECYNFPTLQPRSTFCGYVIASGSCKIKGRPGEVVFDVDGYPERNSFVNYNLSSTDALQNQEFITWGTAVDSLDAGNIRPVVTTTMDDDDEIQLSSNVRMNLLIHATQESSLRFLMDSKTGDNIKLYGSGVIRATWHNKQGMQIFGNYLVDHGSYHMTIRQLVEKDFEFLSGSGLTFNGNPSDSKLNLHAKYVVNSVPLSDLNLGSSFNGTTRVNCLMNITGTPASPVMEFGLELPQASTDIQQMITSLINSEEEMNQQVVYLLAIGRFYNSTETESSTQTSKTSLAMQSFISGTVSQKFNSALSGLMKNNNWNFGANVSPGDEGWNNAEYEGTISGRMFNNRLLIDGQFGYRDNKNATTSFIGDFDIRYLLLPSGNISLHVYNQASDRYFTKSTLNTQGLGIILKHDFSNFHELLPWRRKR